MIDSLRLRTLAAVVAEGGFEAAARSLHVTPSAVSQRIKSLERDVGQVLVRRTRPGGVTEAGQPLLRLAGQLALLEREALAAARAPLDDGGADRIRMTVVVNADSLATWFPAALARVPADPPVAFDLRRDDQEHTAALLRDGSAMAAVTAEREPVQGCRVHRLGAMRYLALAAPALAERYFVAGPAPGLTTAPMLVYDRKDQLQHRFLRLATRRRLEPPIHYVPSVSGFAEAIRLGLGWGMAPEGSARVEIAAGRCVDIAPGRWVDVPLYWQYWGLESAVLRALTEAVRSAAAESLR